MADVHDYLRRVLTEDSTFDWRHVVAALREVAAEDDPSSETEGLVRRLASLEREVEVHDHSAPHAMSPTDMIRAHAVQTLARWDASGHRDHIQHAADTGRSELLRAIARSHLPSSEGS